jgi:hypothetical protein
MDGRMARRPSTPNVDHVRQMPRSVRFGLLPAVLDRRQRAPIETHVLGPYRSKEGPKQPQKGGRITEFVISASGSSRGKSKLYIQATSGSLYVSSRALSSQSFLSPPIPSQETPLAGAKAPLLLSIISLPPPKKLTKHLKTKPWQTSKIPSHFCTRCYRNSSCISLRTRAFLMAGRLNLKLHFPDPLPMHIRTSSL